MTKGLVQRTFSDISFPAWWAFWQDDPRAAWWDDMSEGTCYGMALSGGRFSTALQPFLSAVDGRSAATWAVPRTPLLPGPLSAAEPTYKRELLQTLATDFISQYSTEAQASFAAQKSYFASRSRAGQGAATLRSQLESVMSSGRGSVGPTALTSERPIGLATVAIWGQNGGGHAVVAYNIRDSGGGAFQIDVWDNNRPGKIDSISVRPDGSWAYGPLGWYGGAGKIAFMPEYSARGLHIDRGGTTSSGHETTIVDVPPGVDDLHATAEAGDGTRADVSTQPVLVAPGGDAGSMVVTDGSRLRLNLTDKRASATARGHGAILEASGLTGASNAPVDIAFDIVHASLATHSPRAGTLAVTRDELHASSSGASGLGLSRSGAATVVAKRGGRISLVLSSAADGPLRSATLSLQMPRNGSATISGRQAKRLIRHGGRVGVIVRQGKRRSPVRAFARSVAHIYQLRARIRVSHRRAGVVLNALRRLPPGAEGQVRWKLRKGKRILRRRTIELDRPRTGHTLGKIRLPKHSRGVTVKAVVRVIVKKPGPAQLIAADAQRLRQAKPSR